MNKDMLVEIFVSSKTPDGTTTSEPAEGKIATGYPVGKNRILTARHALYPNGGDVSGHIVVRWHYLKGKPEYGWREAKIIDCGFSDDLDVALLKCDFPERIDYFCNLEPDNPKKEVKWESEGFARSGKRDNIRKPIPLGGEAFNAADNADWLVLTAKGKVEVPKLWSGISGAPVFILGTKTIIGVIVECPPHHAAGLLHATSTWKLLACEGFRQEIEYDIRKEKRDQILSDITTILSTSPEVLDSLSVGLSVQGGSSDEGKSVLLADALVNLPSPQLLIHCETVMARLVKIKKPAAAAVVRELVYYLLPIVFDQRIIEQVCSTSNCISSVEVATPTVVEIVMSGKDGRAVQYRPCDANNDALEGVWQLEDPPGNSGLGSTGFRNDFIKQMVNDFASLDDLVAGQKQNLSEDDKIALAAQGLKISADYEKQTRFSLFSLSKKREEREAQVGIINELKDLFPAIVFIDCTAASEVIEREREDYWPLKKIHKMEV